jgi:DNA-binding LacI/PurR family transcriptional regulator
VVAKPREKSRVRKKDLARALGVSPATISNAFHHPERLSAELRERVAATARELGCSAGAGRAPRPAPTGTLGIAYTDALPWAFVDPPFSEFLQGVAEVAQQARLRLLLAGAPGHDRRRGAAGWAAVDGVVFYAPPRDDERIPQVIRRRLPAVLVDAAPVPGLPLVTIDDEGGAFALVDHLLGLGHQRLGIVSLPLFPGGRLGPAPVREGLASPSRTIAARFAGYAAAARRHGLDLARCARAVSAGVNGTDQGRLAAHALLEATFTPTALVCMSDQLALGALAAARERGLSVPDRLSVVGFDDIPEAVRSAPPLTTVRQPLAEKGRLAARLLVDQLAGGRAASRQLPTQLVVRGSCAPPSGARAAAVRR